MLPSQGSRSCLAILILPIARKTNCQLFPNWFGMEPSVMLPLSRHTSRLGPSALSIPNTNGVKR